MLPSSGQETNFAHRKRKLPTKLCNSKRERKHDEIKKGRVCMRAQCLWQQGRRGKLKQPSTCVCAAGLYHPPPPPF